jgi:uncharacterized caspase-like protein/peptidoglycan hydrolase-like protein with peptidoglycan-binding domain
MKSQNMRTSRAIAGADDVARRLMRSIWLLPMLAAAMMFVSAAGATTTDGKERRVALVIGNSAYQFTPHLPNPTNDAEEMAAALQRLGFEVSKGIDLDHAETELIIREFTKKLPGADVALLFYAGHGIQVARQNYLIPVDAQLADETDLHFEATDLNLVLNLMEREPRVNLVFLDACRDNPLSQKLARSMGSTRSTAIGRGLALVNAQDGSFIAFATQPDNVALDGEGNHSPFTAALLNHIETPGLSLSDMMIRVRNDVKTTTNGQQVPKEESSLTSSFYFQPAVNVAEAIASVEPSAGPASTAATPAASTVDKEVVFWESIKDSSSPGQFEAYLAQFPDGTFAPLARVRLEELKAARTAEQPGFAKTDQLATLTPPTAVEPAPEQVERSIGLTRQGRSRVQLALTLLGYSTGGTDGVLGPRSRAAISAWQTDQGETGTGYLTNQQHAALLDAAAPELVAWDAEQKRIAAEKAQQQAAAAAAAKKQQTQTSTYATTTKAKQDAAAQAELERQKKENEELKKALAEKQAEEKDDSGMNIGIGIGGAVGTGGGVGIFPSLSIFN